MTWWRYRQTNTSSKIYEITKNTRRELSYKTSSTSKGLAEISMNVLLYTLSIKQFEGVIKQKLKIERQTFQKKKKDTQK